MVGNQSKNPAGLALIATDSFVYFGGHQVDYHHLSGSKNVDVSGRMIVWVDHDPQTIDTQGPWACRDISKTQPLRKEPLNRSPNSMWKGTYASDLLPRHRPGFTPPCRDRGAAHRAATLAESQTAP